MFPRTLLRTSLTTLLTAPRFQPALRRAMATTTTPTQEWLVIVPDFPAVLEKRLAVRGNHLQGLLADPEHFWQFGGAMLEEPIKEGETPKMKGSAMLCVAATEAEVVERLRRDVYVTSGVWDIEKIQVIPFKSAVRKAL
ncbi:uncharacterized protein BDZ99DRAFT_463516 [Mytilinidion resinicola]|uniref:YCII-related domain-containing protein n=1 Tax=Mytilinidion resinicola TaxID=574789 RepID=A0A6A6YLJ7_9PEZI|nr:uncharacterized protein BDZ99DRAFT_463516 [Mytilinidion resinicola]KAF2809752.1 hypothetical protein BDZ99DRAFT_463516 [Mytilinidion resinicola]